MNMKRYLNMVSLTAKTVPWYRSFSLGASHVVKLFVPVSICMLIVILTIKTTSLWYLSSIEKSELFSFVKVHIHRVGQHGRKNILLSWILIDFDCLILVIPHSLRINQRIHKGSYFHWQIHLSSWVLSSQQQLF